MKTLKIVPALILFAIVSCSDKVEQIPVFNIGEAINNPAIFKAEGAIQEIKPFPLNLPSDGVPVGRVARFYIKGDTLLITDTGKEEIHVYSFSDGNSLYKISREGRGPEEYYNVYRTIFFNDRLYIDGPSNYFRVYDLKGNYLNTITINTGSKAPLHNSIPERFPLKDHKFAAYHFNDDGQVDKLITIYDADGNVDKIYPNKYIFHRKNKSHVGGFGNFYQYKDDVFFSEQSNDTIFKITDNGLVPHRILQLDPHQRISYEELDWDGNDDKIFYYTMFEMDKYLIATHGDGLFFCNKESGRVVSYPYDRMDSFAAAIFQNAENEQYSENFRTFLYPHNYLDAVEDGSLPAELKLLNLKENDNPVFLEIVFK